MSEAQQEWTAKVIEAMRQYEVSHVGVRSPFIDVALAYNLGWKPVRAARAMLGLNFQDYSYLVDLQIQWEKDHEPVH